MKKYNIYIVNIISERAIEKHTSNVLENKMYKALVECMRSINHLFEAVEVEVWSKKDIKYKNDIKWLELM